MDRSGGRSYTPTEITAMMLSTVRRRTDSYLGLKGTRAVLTVPAYFDESQRQATREAAVIAGYDVVNLIAEPTAAALAYGFERDHLPPGYRQAAGIAIKRGSSSGTIGVYDLGGGTFDFSILEIGEGVFEVKAVAGDNRLGGHPDAWVRLWAAFNPSIPPELLARLVRDPHREVRLRAAENPKIFLEDISKPYPFFNIFLKARYKFSNMAKSLRGYAP